MSLNRLMGLVAAAAAGLMLSITAALAHPHIFIDAKAAISFDANGNLSQIHNSWTFDEAFSAWAVQGLDANHDGKFGSDELQHLADVNMATLPQYGYYTAADEGDRTLQFTALPGDSMSYDGKRLTLDFSVKPAAPYRIADTLQLAISDPQYYVAINFQDPGDIALVGAPPACAISLQQPKPLDPQTAQRLYELGADVTTLPPDLAKAVRDVQGAILLHCPPAAKSGTEPVSQGQSPAASQAPTAAQGQPLSQQLAQGTAPAPSAGAFPGAPFAGPPVEPGFALPRTGPLAFLAWAQEAFYQEMTHILGQLRTDYTAFWLLGGLSFLYGIIHAAGPGHGKVVIGSYMLANDAQVRRGIWLSFISAMIQSAVAVAFILVAASVLHMTSIAMSDAATWITILSYGLIAVLGLWLIIRHVFGLGHHHHHDHSDHHHDHAGHEHGHIHAHAADLHTHLEPAAGAPHRHHELESAAALAPSAAAHAHVHEHDEHDHHDHAHPHEHDHAHPHHAHDDDPTHGHHHVVTADAVRGNWREQLSVVVAVGMRPCSGALVVLVFALSQGVLLAGIASVFLMGLGTAITVAVLATLAATAKGLAGRLMKLRGGGTSALFWWIELAGACLVFVFGILLTLASIGLASMGGI